MRQHLVRNGDHDAAAMTVQLEVRPLRFRSRVQHPCAKVRMVPATGASARNKVQGQVLGD